MPLYAAIRFSKVRKKLYVILGVRAENIAKDMELELVAGYTTDTSGVRRFLTGVRATPGGSNRKARLHPGFSHLLTLSVVMSMLPYQPPHLPDYVEERSGDARDDREGFQDAIQQI